MPATACPTTDPHTFDPLELLTVQRCADLLNGKEGSDTSEVYRALRRGELHAVRIGRALRIRRVDLQAFIDARTGTYIPRRCQRAGSAVLTALATHRPRQPELRVRRARR